MSLRNLKILALITMISVLAAIGVILTDQNAVNSRFEPRPAFPDLADSRLEITDITIAGEERKIHLQRNGSGPWRAMSSDGYPADQAAVARLIAAMETLILEDPRTEKPENFAKLKLADPGPGSEAVQIMLLDREEALISGLILGAMQTAPTPDRPGQFYVRLAESGRAWLAQGRVIAPPVKRSWLDQKLGLPLDTDIRSITVSPAEGRKYKLERETADGDFSIKKLPKGKRLISPSSPLQLAQSMAFLTIEDARSRPDKLGRPAAKVAYEMFDDRRLEITQWEEEAGTWLAIDLKGDWADPLQSRAASFIFRIAPTRAKALSPELDTLLTPTG